MLLGSYFSLETFIYGCLPHLGSLHKKLFHVAWVHQLFKIVCAALILKHLHLKMCAPHYGTMIVNVYACLHIDFLVFKIICIMK